MYMGFMIWKVSVQLTKHCAGWRAYCWEVRLPGMASLTAWKQKIWIAYTPAKQLAFNFPLLAGRPKPSFVFQEDET